MSARASHVRPARWRCLSCGSDWLTALSAALARTEFTTHSLTCPGSTKEAAA